MRTKKTITYLLIFSILISTFLALFPSPVQATVIFEDDYETGDYSKWTDIIDDDSSSMEISSTIVFDGNYSANCSITGTNSSYAFVYRNVSSVPILYNRQYIRLSSLPPANSETDLLGILDVVATGEHLGTLAIQNDGVNVRWKLEYFNSNPEILYYSPLNSIKANTWYYVEIMVKTGFGNGQVSVWIAEDNTTITESSPTINQINLTNDLNPIGTAFFGGFVTGANYPVEIYSDSVVLSDVWTGPRDFTSPNVGTISASSHSIGFPVTLSSFVTDDVGIDTIIPSWNNSGTWVNQTAINVQGNKNFTATLTGTWNSNPDTVVSSKFYAKDTSNNWAASSQANFILNNYAVTLTANQTGLTQEDTVRINLTVTKNGVAFTNFLTNASKDGSLFATNIAANFNDRENISTTHIYTISSLYDNNLGESVSFTTNTLNISWAKSIYVVTLSGNQSSLIQGDTLRVNLAVTKNGLAFNNFLANITRDSTSFANNVMGSFSDQQIHAISHTYRVSSLYDSITQENVTFTAANTLDATWASSNYIVTLFINQTGITAGNTVNIYLTVMKNGLTFSSYLANITKDNVLFISNKATSFNDTETSAIERQYKVSSLYDLTSSENVTFTTAALNVNWASSPTPTPTPSPTESPTITPTTTPTPFPTTTVTPLPSPTSTASPTPKPTEEGLSIAVIAAIVIATIVITVIALLLLVKSKKLKI